MIIGSSGLCPRNDHCLPTFIPKIVPFNLPDDPTRDGFPPKTSAIPQPPFSNWLHRPLPPPAPLDYDFDAVTTAWQLRADVILEHFDDILTEWFSSWTSLVSSSYGLVQCYDHRQRSQPPSFETALPGFPLEGRPFIDHMPTWV